MISWRVFHGNPWRRFVACDGELVAAGRQLLESDHGPVLLEALSGGEEFRAAVDFVARYRPHPFVVNALDLLLPLAIEGGIEQVDAAEVVETADRAAVRSALGPLVERVLMGSGDQYLEYAGLIDLLDRLGEAVLLRRVVDAARHSDDPEVRELVADHPGTGVEDQPVSHHETFEGGHQRRPAAAKVSGAAAARARQALRRYARAWRRHNTASFALKESGFVDHVPRRLSEGADLAAGARFLSSLLAEVNDRGPRSAIRVVAATAEPYRAQLLDLLVDEVLDDPRDQRRSLGALLWLLVESGEDALLTRVVAARRRSANLHSRSTSTDLPDGSAPSSSASSASGE
jgi:hypothetical protein